MPEFEKVNDNNKTPPTPDLNAAKAPTSKPSRLEDLIGVARIGAWDKLMAFCSHVDDPQARARAHRAAGFLVEGYLAFGTKKIEIYHACRAELCQLLVWAQFDARSESALVLCHEATVAVQSLINV